MEREIGTTGRLAALKQAVAAIEGRRVAFTRPGAEPSAGTAAIAADPHPGLDFGLDLLDRRLGPGGGLAFGALHEIACDETRDVGALTGFATALIARLLDRRGGRVVWITTAEARREGGGPHAPGLAAFGLDPGRRIDVAVERPEEALWAFEEAVACPGTAAVVAEIPGRPAVLDLTATRRLALRAADDGGRGFALLARASGPAQTTAAATRWRVAARSSRPIGGFVLGLGRPAFRLDLEKNREGRLGRFDIEWNPHDRRFLALPPDPGAVPAPAADRPPASAGGGRVLAFERGDA